MRILIAAALATAFAAPAAAHIVLADPQAQAGSYYAGFLRVSHGCAGSDTIALRVHIPDGVMMAHPQPKPGWTLTIEHQRLATPIPSEGGTMLTERVSAIIWTGRLPADEFDQFGIMMKLPTTPGSLYFPVEQRCEKGENRWVDIPASGQAWHSVPNPAPVLLLQAPDEMENMDHMKH